jgi:hypothetical protein
MKKSLPSRPSFFRSLLAVCFTTTVAVAICTGLATAQSPNPIQPRSWYLTNNFACVSEGTTTTCGPHLAMDEGNGNGSFPTGLVEVADGASRIWIAPEISPLNIDYSTSVWTLDVGGAAVVTSFSWTVGLWDWSTSTFTPAEAPETVVTQTGRSTFAPTGPFLVPGRRLVAFRATGNSGNGSPSLFDVYDELGGNSPTSLTVAGQPSDVAPPEVIINDADKVACDSTGATLQSDCGWRWLARYGGTLSGTDAATDVVVSPDGTRVFVTGVSEGVPPRQTDFATIAYDAASGATLWTARLDGAANSDDRAVADAISPDGNHLYVTGTTCAAKGAINCTGDMDYLTVSYDAATGAEEWRATFGGPAAGYDSPTALAVSSDGAVVAVTGLSWGGAAYDYATVAYDAHTGDRQWFARYHGPGAGSDTAQAVAISPDSTTAYVTGSSKGEASGSDFATVAYNLATGETRWTARFDGAAHADDLAAALVVAPDGRALYVTGSTQGINSGRDYAVIAYSTATGDVVWTQTHDGQWNGDDWPSAITVSPDGAQVFVTGREDEDALSSEAATVAYAANTGAELWVSRYSGRGKHENQARAIAVTPDGGAVVVAVTSLSEFQYSSADYVTILYGANFGEARWSARYDGPGKDDDEPAALALSPDGSKAFVTGLSTGYRTSSTSDYDYATVAYSLPVPPTVVSRKTHGSAGVFDINLPLTETPGIECRSGGANGDHQIIFTFANPLTSVDGAGITGGTGTVSSNEIDSNDPHNYVVNLTGVTNAQTIAIMLFGANDGTYTGDIVAPMGVLLGDVNANGRTDAGDVTQVRNRTVSIPDQQTFRFDVNASGRIDAGDVTVTRNASVTVLP